MPGPLPFRAASVPVVGQPFRLRAASVPVDAVLDCGCGGERVTVAITMSGGAACPSCGRQFNVVFDPMGGGLGVLAGDAPTGQVAS